MGWSRLNSSSQRTLAFRSMFLVAVLLLVFSRLACAATYNLPNGTLPAGCSRSGGTVTCGSLNLSWNDIITVSGKNRILNINGNASLANTQINIDGSAGDLTINISGQLTTGSSFGSVANINVGGSANLASANHITGNLTANTIQTNSNTTIVGNLIGGTVSTGSANTVDGNISGSMVTINSSNSTINGSIQATSHVHISSGSTVNGDISGVNITTTSAVALNGNIVASGDFTLASGSSVAGSVSAKSITLLSSNANIVGSATADETITLNWNGTVAGDATAPHIISNGGQIYGGAYCDTSGGSTPVVCSSSGGDCSPFIGQATINEVHVSGNNTRFIEIKMLDEDIPKNEYDTWSLHFCSSQRSPCQMVSLAAASFDQSTYPWLVLTESGISHKDYIDFGHGNGDGMDIRLNDAQGRAIDYLSVDNYSSSLNVSCGFLYDTTMSSVNSHTIMRLPDGTGAWAITGPGNSGKPTEGSSNDSDDGADLTCGDVTMSAIGTQVAGIKSEEYSLCLPDFDGDVSYGFSYECVNPSSCVGQLTISDERDAGDCRYYRLRFDDVGQIRLNYTISTDEDLTCASNDFVVKPHHFSISDIVCSNAAADAAGDVFCTAGADFTVTVTAENADSEPTLNFGEEDDPQIVAMNHNLIAPVGGSIGALADDLTWSNFSQGVAQNVILNWSEVGIITLTPVAINYLSAGDVTGDESVHIGRFIPDAFAIENMVAGQLTDACSDFSYAGQTIEGYVAGAEPHLSIRAVNALEPAQTTQNYRGDFAKLEATDILLGGPSDGADADQLGADGENRVQVDTLLEVGTLVDNENGTLTYTASNNDEYVYLKENALVAPFVSRILLQLSSVEDADGVAAADLPQTIEVGGSDIHYGRLALDNAYGSETLPLTIPVRTEYFNGTTFSLNEDDSCTVYDSTHLSPPSPISIGDGQTAASGSGTLISGQGNDAGSNSLLSLSAPGGGNDGSVNLEYDLEAAGLDWLQFDWNGDGVADNNPTATATFGIFKGNPRIIYSREMVW